MSTEYYYISPRRSKKHAVTTEKVDKLLVGLREDVNPGARTTELIFVIEVWNDETLVWERDCLSSNPAWNRFDSLGEAKNALRYIEVSPGWDEKLYRIVTWDFTR